MNFTNVILEIAGLFIIIGIGLICGRKKIISQELESGFSTLILMVANPSLILMSMQRTYSEELIHNSVVLIALCAVFFILLILTMECLYRIPSFKARSHFGTYQFLFLFGNVTFLGFPVANAIFGDIGIFYTAMFNIPYFFLMFSYGIFILGRHTPSGFWRKLRNPGLLACALGFLLFLFQVPIPSFISTPLTMIGNITIPLSLLVVGSNLSRSQFSAVLKARNLWSLALAKMVVLPLVLLCILQLFPLNQFLLTIPVVIMGMPAALTAGSFTATYGGNEQLANQHVVLSNLLSVITIPLLLFVILRTI